jgi:hypothetical protein
MRGGILTLIHSAYFFPNNINKIPILAKISSYFQILNIQNLSLKPWLLLNIYMPSHKEDLSFSPKIKHTIMHQITNNQNHNTILLEDFN